MYVRIPKKTDFQRYWFVSSLLQCTRGILSPWGTSSYRVVQKSGHPSILFLGCPLFWTTVYIYIGKLAAALVHSQFSHINSHKMQNYNCQRMCTLQYNVQIELWPWPLTFDLGNISACDTLSEDVTYDYVWLLDSGATRDGPVVPGLTLKPSMNWQSRINAVLYMSVSSVLVK